MRGRTCDVQVPEREIMLPADPGSGWGLSTHSGQSPGPRGSNWWGGVMAGLGWETSVFAAERGVGVGVRFYKADPKTFLVMFSATRHSNRLLLFPNHMEPLLTNRREILP